MSLLVDHQIRECVEQYDMLKPFSEGVQGKGVISFGLTSVGYDLRLGHTILVFKNTFNEIIDPKGFRLERVFDKIENIPENEPVLVPPNGYLLGYSLEYIRVPRWLKGRCCGKSTLARCGIVINTTPLEPGWHGHLTIEIANVTPCPVKVYVGEGIAQLEFDLLSATVHTDYEQKAGRYQGQSAEPVPLKPK